MSNPHQQFVIVALSGGVDSAVSTLLLKQQGYHVEAMFMQNWEDSKAASSTGCTSSIDLEDAHKICDCLKIKLHVVNFSKEYWHKVFQIFLDEYASCRTPNPDVLCNKEIKFKAFLEHAKLLGSDFIATGHYARRVVNDSGYYLLKGVDQNKDQSYFLHLLNQVQLASSLFPLGDLTKPHVREIAKDAKLSNHTKKDSTGICFIGERKFKDFIGEYMLPRPGAIVSDSGKVLGQHNGLMFYTIGQRQGIGVGGKKESLEAPWYVAIKNLKTNELIVTQNREHPALSAKKLICQDVHWILGACPTLPITCTAKIRYRQNDQKCVVNAAQNEKFLSVDFIEPQWAITPGQSVVFYQDEICLGGGIIK